MVTIAPTPGKWSGRRLSRTRDAAMDAGDVQYHGTPGTWRLVFKAWSDEEGWMKSTKAMAIDAGVLVQVSTQQGGSVAEALDFIPGARLTDNPDGTVSIIGGVR